LDQFDQRRKRPLTLVVAPAGFYPVEFGEIGALRLCGCAGGKRKLFLSFLMEVSGKKLVVFLESNYFVITNLLWNGKI
jgi:hypothetical protein